MLEKMNIIDIYRLSQPTTMQCTFFSGAHGTFTNTEHISWQKESLNKFWKAEIAVYHVTSQQNNTRTQQQKKPQKIFQPLKTEQHTTEWPVGHQRNKKVPRI
jgi:hypothetical protein